MIKPLSQQAMDLGFDGLIIESHCNPCEAWSDASQQVTPADLKQLLADLVIRESMVSTEDLSDLRKQIDELDSCLLELLSKRMRVSREIGTYKKEHNIPVLQTGRYEEILDRRSGDAAQMDMDDKFIKTILKAIHEESVQQQIRILND